MTDLARLRALLAEATPGPWEEYTAPCCPDMGGVSGPRGRRVCAESLGNYGHPMIIEDAALIAAAVNALPALLDEIERARR